MTTAGKIEAFKLGLFYINSCMLHLCLFQIAVSSQPYVGKNLHCTAFCVFPLLLKRGLTFRHNFLFPRIHSSSRLKKNEENHIHIVVRGPNLPNSYKN